MRIFYAPTKEFIQKWVKNIQSVSERMCKQRPEILLQLEYLEKSGFFSITVWLYIKGIVRRVEFTRAFYIIPLCA